MFDLAQTVGTLTLLGDESRIRLCALLHQRELSVTQLVDATGLAQSRVSSHLARLREGGFVRDRRAGQSTFYALVPTLPASALQVIEAAVASADTTLSADRKRLAEREARTGTLPDALAGELERHYTPGRTWQSLAMGLGALLQLGDVIDVGSADGAAAAQIAPNCRSLTCVDSSAAMVEAARERFADQPHVRAVSADAHALPFDTASFDAALLFHTLTYVERPKRAVEECARVLRPGGRLVILSLDEHEETRITAAYGERHAGFSAKTLRSHITKAGLEALASRVVCRENRKPHFRVVLAVAKKP